MFKARFAAKAALIAIVTVLLGSQAEISLSNAGSPAGISLGTGANFALVSGGNLVLGASANYEISPDSAANALTDIAAARAAVQGLAKTVIAIDIGGATITPGVYQPTANAALGIATSMVLDGGGDPNAGFIFYTVGAITVAADITISLINGAQAENVLWVSDAAITIGARTNIPGSFIAAGAITTGDSTRITGAILGLSDVTLGASTQIIHHINLPAPVVIPIVVPVVEPTVVPTPEPVVLPTPEPSPEVIAAVIPEVTPTPEVTILDLPTTAPAPFPQFTAIPIAPTVETVTEPLPVIEEVTPPIVASMKYDPMDHPKETTALLIVALGALSLVSAAGISAQSGSASMSAAGKSQGYLAQLSRGGALVASTALGAGDKRALWSKRGTERFDRAIQSSGQRISGFSPLATRIISDGNYLRSLTGPWSVMIYPVAILVGVLSSRSLHQAALPPALSYILLMMAIGTLDAFAGVLISITFALSVLIGGHFTTLHSLLTVAGVALLAFSPALLAGAFRPFRRPVWDFTSLWERATDYLLASVLTGWIVQQIVLGLPGLSGLQLPITEDATPIAFFAAAMVVLRFAFEDFSMRLFPQRLAKLEPVYRERTILQQVLATIFKVTIFSVMAAQFIGISAEFFIGVALFALPLIMGIFEDKFPKSTRVQRWMPTGIIELLVMTIGGYFLAILLADRYPNARTYVLVSFVLLSLPAVALKLLGLFGVEGGEDWKVTKIGKITYRVFGVVALAILLYIILGGLLR